MSFKMNSVTKNILLTICVITIIFFLLAPVMIIGTGNTYTPHLLNNTHAKEVSYFAQNFINEIQNGNFSELKKYYSKYINENNSNPIASIKSFLPTQHSDDVQLISLKTIFLNAQGNKYKMMDALLQYQFKEKRYLIKLIYSQQKDTTQVLGIHIKKLTDSLQNINKVVFSKATTLQYFVLTLIIIIPIIILTSLIFCIRTNNLKHKGLWIIFIIFGLIGFHFNWTTQSFIINPITLQLFGSGYFRASRYAPLMLSFSLPIGAIIFLTKQVLSKKLSPCDSSH